MNARGQFLAFYILKRGLDLHDPTSVLHLKDDVICSNSHIFFSFSSSFFKLSISFSVLFWQGALALEKNIQG